MQELREREVEGKAREEEARVEARARAMVEAEANLVTREAETAATFERRRILLADAAVQAQDEAVARAKAEAIDEAMDMAREEAREEVRLEMEQRTSVPSGQDAEARAQAAAAAMLAAADKERLETEVRRREALMEVERLESTLLRDQVSQRRDVVTPRPHIHHAHMHACGSSCSTPHRSPLPLRFISHSSLVHDPLSESGAALKPSGGLGDGDRVTQASRFPPERA